MNYTTADARRDFKPLLKRGAVFELGRKMGLAERTMRLLIEGEDAPVKRHVISGSPSKYFKLEDVLAAIG